MSQNTELKAQAKKPGLNKKGIAAWINNYSFILIALAIFIAYLFINHGATTWSGVMNILRHSAVVGIMAFGMGLVIITGGIDLSVGSMLALVGSFSVVVFNATDSVFLTLLFALVAGGLCGLFNGVLIGLVKMPAFIVTLATMLIFRSVAQYYLRTTGSSIFNMTGTLDHYASFYGFGQLKIATVPVVGIVLLVVTVIMVFISTCTKFGKTVYALGSNERAAALAGINVNRVKVIAYTVAGFCCGIAAVIYAARFTSASDGAGVGGDFNGAVCSIIGGNALYGGHGGMVQVFIGTVTFGLISNILQLFGLSTAVQYIVQGAILLLAINLDNLKKR